MKNSSQIVGCSLIKKTIFYALMSLVCFYSCFNTKIAERSEIKQKSNSNSTQNLPYVFQNCESSNKCVGLFDCYHSFLLSDQLFEYPNYNNSGKYFNMDSLLNCTLLLYFNNEKRKYLAGKCLFSYYYKSYIRDRKSSFGFPPNSGIHKKILTNWNTSESFEVCMLYMDKNIHDSMGHGDCTNLTIEFFNQIILKKIKTIGGMDFWTYFDRNVKNRDHGPEDCYDSLYEVIYPLLKQAWEDGKIELKESPINNR